MANRETKNSTGENLADSISSLNSLSEQTSTSSSRNYKRSSTTPLLSSTASSTTASPKPSREGSPVRPTAKTGITAATRAATRSRKNSSDLSPHRTPSAPGPSIPTVPSAAAIQRALSAAGTPHLPPPTHQDGAADPTRTSKVGKTAHSSGSRTGSSTSTVSSPPPSTPSASSKPSLNPTRNLERSQSTPTPPTIVVERPNRGATAVNASNESDATDDHPPKAAMRTPSRGTSGNGPALDAIQENSLPAAPATGAAKSASGGKATEKERPAVIAENPMEEAFSMDGKAKSAESGNESTGNKSADVKSGDDGKVKKSATAANSTRPPTVQPKKSFSQLPLKGKTPGEGSVKNMTVETETVSSIPQVALGGGAVERNLGNRADTTGSLRLQPSNETIRPKKEKKKTVRKAPSLNAGTGTLSSRPPHYYHLYSRAPSPESRLSLSISSSPGSVFGRWTLASEPSARSRSKDRRAMHHRQSASESAAGESTNEFQGLQHRARTILTPFRGRPASSKADIFEAKVASAVGEADSSDSEETFVYESNPPEPHSARPHRMHSRTPSVASTVSQLDYHKGRQDGHHSVVGKKSMKFSNNYNSIGYANEGDGTVRGPSQTGRGNNSHHHVGRYGRGGHTSLFDNDSPFPNAKRNATGHLSHPSPRQSPRNGHFARANGGPRKTEEVVAYDLEDEGADDERTPLIGSNRTGRNRRRPVPGSVRQMYTTDERKSSLCSRVAGYTLLGSILAVLIAAIIVVLIMCTKPLINVHIQDIRNVLASEQEMMFDLNVHAINPNLIAVQIDHLDVNIFAKSKHVGTSEQWRAAHPKKPFSLLPPTTQPMSSKRSPQGSIFDDPADIIAHLVDGGVDEGTDPIDDPATDSQTMLLGRIFSFDSPLVFEPSPIQREYKSSIGEVRLAKPGNSTEEGGTKRWEQVLQHEFELIVRGVLVYSSPISQTISSVHIGGRVIVQPSQEDKAGNASMGNSNWKEDEGITPGSNVIVKKPGRHGLKARWFAA